MYKKLSLFLSFVAFLLFLSACNGSSGVANQSYAQSQFGEEIGVLPLNPENINFIFVVSPDIAYNTNGDVYENTGNLTPQGLNRSLQLATYLNQNVLGNKNATNIYTLQPASHLQTANNYPDMASIEFIQQFAMLNQTTLPIMPSGTLTSYGFPINSSYTNGVFPSGVSSSANTLACSNCQGLSFNNLSNSNDTIISSIVSSNTAGFYVFSAPWETVTQLMALVKAKYGSSFVVPQNYKGSNSVYAISISPNNTSATKFYTYNFSLNPSPVFETITAQISTTNPCQAAQFSITATNPKISEINKNQTVYFIRHAEAHPNNTSWDNGNYIAAGQWRALSLPVALSGKINPSMVISVDPAQVISGSNSIFSYVRPSLTAQPYAIANNIPYTIVTNLNWSNYANVTTYLFMNGTFSNKTILVAWEHGNISDIVNTLSGKTYYTTTTNPNSNQAYWAYGDYDSIWTVTLDASGSLSVTNNLCEGINSATLPVVAPSF